MVVHHISRHCVHSARIGAIIVERVPQFCLLTLLALLLASLFPSAYGDPSCLSPELLQSWTKHLRERTSCEVLLDVFTNSTGPLPQDLLPLNTVVS